MKINVEIDDDLMESALKVAGLKTKKETIETGLRLLVKLGLKVDIKDFRGKLLWVGDMDKMRSDK